MSIQDQTKVQAIIRLSLSIGLSLSFMLMAWVSLTGFSLATDIIGTIKSSLKITDNLNGFEENLSNGVFFGASLSDIGDIDGNGVPDLVVGATHDDTNGASSGTAYVLLMNADGTVKASQQIPGGIGYGSGDNFGKQAANIGDVDGDGIPDIAVGTVANSGRAKFLFCF